MIYLKLFWSFFQIGLFSIGGGYAAMPLIEQQTVNINGWLTAEGFADIVTIAEMTPGPIALNAATFVGTQVGGFFGAIVATLGCVTPSTFIVLILAYLYYKYRELSVMEGILTGVRPAVIALIASAGVTLVCMALYGSREVNENLLSLDYVSLFIIIIALFVLRKWKIKPIYVMLTAGIIYSIVKCINI